MTITITVDPSEKQKILDVLEDAETDGHLDFPFNVQEGASVNFGNGYNEKNSIALIWSIDDVRHVLQDLKTRGWFIKKYGHAVKLSDEDCMEILEDVERYHDASMGVSWDTIEIYIEKFL